MGIKKASTDIEQQLIDLLKKWSEYPDWINGILDDLVDDSERQDVIDEIENGNVPTPSDAILFAIQIAEDRGREE